MAQGSILDPPECILGAPPTILDDFGRLSDYFLMLFDAIFQRCFLYAYKYNLFSNNLLCLALWLSPLEKFVTCLAILSYAPRFQTLKLHVWIPIDAAVSA